MLYHEEWVKDLASLEMQECLIIYCTKEEYLVPSEFIDACYEFIRYHLSGQQTVKRTTALTEFKRVLDAYAPAALAYDFQNEKARENAIRGPVWDELRVAARQALEAFDIAQL